MSESNPAVAPPVGEVLDAPAIVAVCVVDDAGPGDADDLDQLLDSLAAQDYPNLSVLVIDRACAASPVDRVARRLPDAFVHRLSADPGYAAAANQALQLVDGVTFFLFCRTGYVLEPHTVSALAEEMYRSNAGVSTPKMVEWDDPRRLVAVGMGADRFGVKVDLVEPREFDQEQYDGVEDVFVAPDGVQLVRADLFRELGGFDAAMGDQNEDVDLCWRAHVVGARIVAVPGTSVRRRSAHEAPASHGRLVRNRLRTQLVASSGWTLLTTVPLAILLVLGDAIGSLVSGRRSRAFSILGAVPGVVGDLGDIRTRRAHLQSIRNVSDREVHALQVGGSAALNALARDRFGAGQNRVADLVGSVRENLGPDGDDGLSAARTAALVGAFVAAMLLFGSRDLLANGVVPVGEIPVLPGAGRLLDEWWSGWRSAGLGREAAAPLLYLGLGLLRIVFFWGGGLLDTLLVVAPIGFGAYGASRLVRPLGSPRASALAALAHAGTPLVTSLVGEGRWQALLVWAVAPHLLLATLRLEGSVADDHEPSGRLRVLRFAVGVAVTALVVPMIVPVAVLVVVAVLVASILVARPVAPSRLLVGAVAAVVASIAFAAPWSAQVVSGGGWGWLVGPASPGSAFDSIADLVRFAPGPAAPGFLALIVVACAGVALVLGRRERFDLAARGWSVAVVCWLVAWGARRGWIPFDVPDAAVLTSVASAGIALAVGASVRAVEVDRRGRTLVVRRVAVAAVGIGALASAVGLVGQAFDGRWAMPRQTFRTFSALLADESPEPLRVLWIGDAAVLPLDGHTTERGIHFSVTDGAAPDIIDRYHPAPSGFERRIGEDLDLAVDGRTEHLGRLLAHHGVDVVIVVDTLAPPPYDGARFAPGAAVDQVLERQLDLQRLVGTLRLPVFRNLASAGPVVGTPAGAFDPDGEPLERLAADLDALTRLPIAPDGAGTWRPLTGVEPSADEVTFLVPGDGWEPVGDATVLSTGDGHLTLRPGADPLGIDFSSPALGRLLLLLQLVVVGAGVVLAQPDRSTP